MSKTVGASNKNPNWLYRNDGSYSYSAVKAKALRLGYPFTITQKQYAAIRPIDCWYGHFGEAEGIRLLLDTLDADLGFSVGNTIFTCERHLGNVNIGMVCANTRNIIDPERARAILGR